MDAFAPLDRYWRTLCPRGLPQDMQQGLLARQVRAVSALRPREGPGPPWKRRATRLKGECTRPSILALPSPVLPRASCL